jgi:hypothetical protein
MSSIFEAFTSTVNRQPIVLENWSTFDEPVESIDRAVEMNTLLYVERLSDTDEYDDVYDEIFNNINDNSDDEYEQVFERCLKFIIIPRRHPSIQRIRT